MHQNHKHTAGVMCPIKWILLLRVHQLINRWWPRTDCQDDSAWKKGNSSPIGEPQGICLSRWHTELRLCLLSHSCWAGSSAHEQLSGGFSQPNHGNSSCQLRIVWSVMLHSSHAYLWFFFFNVYFNIYWWIKGRHEICLNQLLGPR
jgi:hypothetical protein